MKFRAVNWWAYCNGKSKRQWVAFCYQRECEAYAKTLNAMKVKFNPPEYDARDWAFHGWYWSCPTTVMARKQGDGGYDWAVIAEEETNELGEVAP